ncbi:protein tweety isoform X2 [Harmonia axyridis]|uniref:protein tweety isoform X2 n=1 Tax=Harmonia axyridis TaxID=115357 RepID=UPI001E276F6D|nr:protein tweety isoform X2 [Harmonia axyridis]
MGVSTGDEAYSIPYLAQLLHSLPHVNISLHHVNSSFNPYNQIYLESLGILGSIPAALLILTLLLLLIYLLTRCCDRKPRPAKSIAALKVILACVSVLCCAAVGLGLYGNDDLHNGFSQLLQEARQVNNVASKIRNQTELMERQLRVQASQQLIAINDIFDEPVSNMSLYKEAKGYLQRATGNCTLVADAAVDIRHPLTLDLSREIRAGERFEMVRWPFTMAILSVLLILCVILLVGVARHNRCALIAFSVCGLLAIIASYVMASVYIASGVALGDLCMAPEKFIEDQGSTELSKEILRYYAICERARANPFTQRLREAKTAIENVRTNLKDLKTPATYLFPKKGLDTKFSSLKNELNSAYGLVTTITALVDCPTFHTHFLRGAKALCNVGLTGLSMMLISALIAGFLLTVLVWVDSHTWIYIRKKKDYQDQNETDPFLPATQANQVVAARTLQRSQGDGCDMRPSEQHHRGAHLSHLRGHTLGRLPSHHHDPILAGPNNGKPACKDFPNFKGFKFDQQHQHKRSIPRSASQQDGQQRTANIQKFSTLGRRPLPQTPDEKARKQPSMPKVPNTSIETPLNPANFRSLQRGAWQDGTSSFQPNAQFRSLQRGMGVQQQSLHSQFRSAKIQDQAHEGPVYANNENERQLYAVTEL